MCGIVGYCGYRDCSEVLVSALTKLEYRGYDSAGICTIDNNTLNCIKTTGKVKNLKEAVKEKSVFNRAYEKLKHEIKMFPICLN